MMNTNEFKSKFYNKLSTALFKQKKYEESFKKAEYIIQNINKDNEVSYYIILYCLIELNKIILANYYADIIKKKFRNEESIERFKDQLVRLDKLNKEFSDKLLNENHELKKEIIDINNNINIKEKIEIEDENKIIKYIPYIIGGSIILFLGGRYIYKKLKNN